MHKYNCNQTPIVLSSSRRRISMLFTGTVITKLYRSVIKIDFIKILNTASLFRSFLETAITIYKPLTNKSNLEHSAIKFLLLFPITIISIQTKLLETARDLNVPLTLPPYLWALLDKVAQRVEKPTLPQDIKPGILGTCTVIFPENNKNLGTLFKDLLHPEFVHTLVSSTAFSSIVFKDEKTKKIPLLDIEGNVIPGEYESIVESMEWKFTRAFDSALEAELARWDFSSDSNQLPYTLSQYFSNFNSSCHREGMPLVHRLTHNNTTEVLGIHKFHDYAEKQYSISYQSLESIHSETSQTVLICFLYLFSPSIRSEGSDSIHQLDSSSVLVNLENLDASAVSLSLLSLEVEVPSPQSDNGQTQAFKELDTQNPSDAGYAGRDEGSDVPFKHPNGSKPLKGKRKQNNQTPKPKPGNTPKGRVKPPGQKREYHTTYRNVVIYLSKGKCYRFVSSHYESISKYPILFDSSIIKRTYWTA